jgi:hypothetical protein
MAGVSIRAKEEEGLSRTALGLCAQTSSAHPRARAHPPAPPLLLAWQACRSLDPGYRPRLTFLVVQKEHKTRLLPKDPGNTGAADSKCALDA